MNIRDRIGLWAYHQLQDRMWDIRRNQPISQKLEELYQSFLESLILQCSDDLCIEKGDPCILRGYEEDGDEAIYWYCSRHAPTHGFCFACGEFYGGTESFDFGPGYCSNCASEFEEDETEYQGWEYE